MYVKLFGSILDSSIWSTDLATRVVWITMLAMADEYGIVYASMDGLANRARISIEECERALKVLSRGDKRSRTKNDRGTRLEGRRVEAVDGGWQVINYQKYRELRSRKQIADAVRQARHREQVRRVTARDMTVTGVTPPTLSGSITPHHDVTVEAEAEADAEAYAEAEASGVEREIQNLDSKKSAKSKSATADAVGGKPHWVRQCATLWANRFGGKTIPWGELGKQLKPVSDDPTLLHRLAAYLTATKPQYVNLARFVQTFASWGNGKSSPQTYSYEPGVKGPAL